MRRKFKHLIKSKSTSQNTMSALISRLQSTKLKPQYLSSIPIKKPRIPELPSTNKSTTKRKHREKNAAFLSTSAAIDLNQLSIPVGGEENYYHVPWEPLKMEKTLKYSATGERLLISSYHLPKRCW